MFQLLPLISKKTPALAVIQLSPLRQRFLFIRSIPLVESFPVFQPDIWLQEVALPRFCLEIFTNSCISLLFPVKKQINYLLNISVLYSYIHRPRHVM